jgi:bacterioferritin (cytochrome b1)
MCANWGYERLHAAIEKRAIEEVKHAEMLIARILFLEGRPVVSELNPMHIGANVEAQHKADWQAACYSLYSPHAGHIWPLPRCARCCVGALELGSQ